MEKEYQIKNGANNYKTFTKSKRLKLCDKFFLLKMNTKKGNS